MPAGFRSRGWSATIQTSATNWKAVLDDSPSLRRTLPDVLPRAFQLGRSWAAQETGLLDLPENCPWSAEQALATGFLPE